MGAHLRGRAMLFGAGANTMKLSSLSCRPTGRAGDVDLVVNNQGWDYQQLKFNNSYNLRSFSDALLLAGFLKTDA